MLLVVVFLLKLKKKGTISPRDRRSAKDFNISSNERLFPDVATSFLLSFKRKLRSLGYIPNNRYSLVNLNYQINMYCERQPGGT